MSEKVTKPKTSHSTTSNGKKKKAKASEESKKKSPRKIVSDLGRGFKTGSTRARLFKVLAAVTDESECPTVKEIQEKAGLAMNSGHLGTLVLEEIARGRIKVRVGYRGPQEKRYKTFCLSALGKKDFEAGLIDGNAHAGHRIGKLWTKARIKAEKASA